MLDGSSVVIHALGFFPSVLLMFSWKLVSGSFLTYEFLSKKKPRETAGFKGLVAIETIAAGVWIASWWVDWSAL